MFYSASVAFFLIQLLSFYYVEGMKENKVILEDCMDAYEICRASKDCRSAYRSLSAKCKVIDGRCGAEMKHLPACGKIMDKIFSMGFSKNRCVCEQNSPKCREIQDKIYKNQCFVSIRHLRKHNLFPHEVSSTDESEPSPSSRTVASTSSVVEDRQGNFPDKGQSGSSEEERNGKILQEDHTDYKLITIILATLLGIFILVATSLFACTRLQRSAFYSRGKEVPKSRTDGNRTLPKTEIYSASNEPQKAKDLI